MAATYAGKNYYQILVLINVSVNYGEMV